MRTFILLLLNGLCITLCGQLQVDVQTYGAAGDNATDNTFSIQQAINYATGNGGGEVIINNGTYLSSTLVLKSNVTLRITAGTTLKALPNNSDFPDIAYNERSWSDTYTKKSLLFAEGVHHVRITGGGTIDGNGFQPNYLQVSKNYRPFGLRFHKVDSLTIDSINLRQAPQWMGHINDCSHVHIHDVWVYNQGWGSNDGIDVDGCVDVLVENCTFDTNDDPLPVKTHGFNICRDVLIRNCTFATYERAVKVGNETLGPIVNVRFKDIVVNPSSFVLPVKPQNAIYCAIADGGSMDSIYFENIQVNAGTDYPIFLRLCDRGNAYDTFPHPPVKYLRNVWFKNIKATASSTIPCSVTGIPGYKAENIYFENVEITVPGGGPSVTGNVPEQIQTRPEGDIWGDSLPAYGLYVRHVSNLKLDNFCVVKQSPDVRPELYFEDTAQIVANPCTGYVSSVEELTAVKIAVYPNPANSTVHIDLTNPAEKINLFTMEGAAVWSGQAANKQTFDISMAQLPQGLYLLIVEAKGNRAQAKIMVSH